MFKVVSKPHKRLATLVRHLSPTSHCFHFANSTSSNSQPLVLIEKWSEEYPTITRVTLNNPKKRNCLSLEMMNELISSINNLDNINPQTRLVCISGSGSMFCSGHDLKEILSARDSKDDNRLNLIFDTCNRLMMTIRNSPYPFIAAPHGMAVAAGCQLTAVCDLTYSTKDCKFATPGINFGLFCSTPSVEISRCIGRKYAMELLLTGESISSEKAKEIGLINDYCSTNEIEDLNALILNTAQHIVKQSKSIVNLGKQGFYKQVEEKIHNANDTAKSCMLNNIKLKDNDEGLHAFVEKRKPVWTDE